MNYIFYYVIVNNAYGIFSILSKEKHVHNHPLIKELMSLYLSLIQVWDTTWQKNNNNNKKKHKKKKCNYCIKFSSQFNKNNERFKTVALAVNKIMNIFDKIIIN